MANNILMDEFHLTVFVPRGLSPHACRAIRRTLDDPRFRAALRRAIRGVIRKFPYLGKARFALSR